MKGDEILNVNRNLRLKIEESIETKQLSENLFYLCLACLNEKITFSKLSLKFLENQRNTIATAAIFNGVSKFVLQDKILKISGNDYPTFKTITNISEMIQNNNYTFVSGFIPDKMIHYKTDDKLQADLARKPVVKKLDVDTEEFKELCEYVAKEILSYPNGISLMNNQKNILGRMKTSQYTYGVILKCFKQYQREIEQALFGKSYKSEFNKLQYITGIVKHYLPDVVKEIERQKRAEIKLSEMDIPIYYFYSGAEYQKKTGKTLSRLNDLW